MLRVEPSGQKTVVIIYQESLDNFEETALRSLQMLFKDAVPRYECRLFGLNTFSLSLMKIQASHVLLYLDLDSLPETFHIDHILSRLEIPRLQSIKVIAQTTVAKDIRRNLKVLPPNQFVYTTEISDVYSWFFLVVQHLFPYRQPPSFALETSAWIKPECLFLFEQGNESQSKLFEQIKPGLESVGIPCFWPEHEDFKFPAQEELLSRVQDNTVLILFISDDGSAVRQTYDRILTTAVEKCCKVTHIQSQYTVHISHVTRKPVFGVSEQVRHKPACAAAEAS